MEFSRLEYWSGWPFPSPGDLSNPGIKPRSPTLWTDSLSAELQGKPKNTGVSSLSLLQHIFPSQESNWGLPHTGRILYRLSSQGSQKHQWGVVSVAQPCPTLCDPMDCSPPGSSVRGILQARILEWVAMPSPEDLPDLGIEQIPYHLSFAIPDPGNLGLYYQELNHIINSLPTHLFLPRSKISWRRWNWE